MSASSTVARMRSSIGLLLAVATMAVVACTLVALVPVYSAAIVDAGLRATVSDAPARARTISVATRAPAADGDRLAADIDEALAPEASAFESLVIAESAPYRSVSPAADEDPDTGTAVVTALASFWGDDVFVAVDGDLEALTAPAADDAPIPAALHRDAAAYLGLAVGDPVVVEATSGGGGGEVALTVVAVTEPADVADPRWLDSPFGREGVLASGSFTEIGPFFVAPEALAALGSEATYSARLALDELAVNAQRVDALIAATDGAAPAISSALDPRPVRVETELGELLRDSDTSVRSTSAVVAAIMLQLAAVALYGLGVAAAVLVASRRTERVLLNSRGIRTAHVARDSIFEAAVIAVPAALLGPPLATIAVDTVGRAGPLAATGLDLDGRLSVAAFAVSIAAAVIAVAVIAWPAVAATRRTVTRPEPADGASFLRRTGLDIVLFVVAALGLWQLQRTGTVATSASPDARSSIDPVLVLTPTLGVAAASLLAVRLLSVAAGGLERIGTRSRRLAPALAGWEAARQPARRDRGSILVVVALAVAAFALVQAVSWQTSQQDQADADVGADIVVTPDLRPGAEIAPADLATSYTDVDGVDGLAPIDDRDVAITSELGAVPLVAIDAARYDEYGRTRADVVAPAATIAELADPVDLAGIALPGGGGELGGTVSVTASTIDVETGERVASEATVRMALVVTDEFGTIQRFAAAEPITTDGGAADSVAVSFGRLDPSTVEGRQPHLVEIEVAVDVPTVDVESLDLDDDQLPDLQPFEIPDVQIAIAVDDLTVGAETIDATQAAWTALPPAPGRYTLVMAGSSTDLAEDSDDGDGEPTLVLAIDTGTTELRQVIERHRFTTATPIDPAGERIVVDALATPDLLDALGIEPGRAVQARIGGLRLQLRIVSATDVVPFASDEPLALLADHATLVAADYLVTGTSPQPDRWALETAETSRDAVTSALIAPPLASTAVEDRWSAAELRTRDPVLVGLTGSLLMAIAAVVTVASVGLVMTAVTGARERRTSHAVLRALGTSRHDLRRWLIRETVPLGVLAITLGATTGLLIATLVLDSLTGDRDGTPAIPPPQLVVPITAIVALMAGALGAIALLPIAMGRLLRGVRPAEELRIGDQL